MKSYKMSEYKWIGRPRYIPNRYTNGNTETVREKHLNFLENAYTYVNNFIRKIRMYDIQSYLIFS